MNQYHIVEIQKRPDGVTNVQAIETKNTLASGLSYYYERCSKMVATKLYTSVTIMMFDSDGKIYENKNLKTDYEEE